MTIDKGLPSLDTWENTFLSECDACPKDTTVTQTSIIVSSEYQRFISMLVCDRCKEKFLSQGWTLVFDTSPSHKADFRWTKQCIEWAITNPFNHMKNVLFTITTGEKTYIAHNPHDPVRFNCKFSFLIYIMYNTKRMIGITCKYPNLVPSHAKKHCTREIECHLHLNGMFINPYQLSDPQYHYPMCNIHARISKDNLIQLLQLNEEEADEIIIDYYTLPPNPKIMQ
jgi:hypothetical protein